MLLSEVYKGNYKYHKAKGFFDNKDKKIQNPPSRKFAFLNSVSIPNEQEIRMQQLKYARAMVDLQHWNKYSQKLTQDLYNVINNNIFSIQNQIQQIENAFDFNSGLGTLNISKNKRNNINQTFLINALNRHNNLILNLKLVYSMFQRNTNPKTIETTLNRLETIIMELENDLIAINQGQIIPDFSTRGYLSYTKWIGDQLKGYLLEVQGTEWFKKRVPTNIEVVNTGSWIIDGKMPKMDIAFFESGLAKKVFIKCKYGEQQINNISLYDLLKKVNADTGSTTISISQEDYISMRQALITGVQAKSGKGAIRFASIPPSTIFSYSGPGRALKHLSYLLNSPYNSKRLRATHENYNALFNYELAKHLNRIVGYENSIMLTRNGLQTTQQFLIDEFTNGKILMAIKLINLQTDKQVDIQLK